MSVEVDTSVPRATDAPSWGRELRLLASLSAPLVAQNVLYLSQALIIVAAVGQVSVEGWGLGAEKVASARRSVTT